MLWLSLLGCGTSLDTALTLPLPVPTEPGTSARPLLARSPMHPFLLQTHADASGVFVLTQTYDGFGLDLRPEAGEGLELHVLSGGEDGATAIFPGPTFEQEAVVASIGSLRFLPSTEPGHLAFLVQDVLYRFDGSGWSTEVVADPNGLDVATAACLGVGPERSVWIDERGVLRQLEDGVDVAMTSPPGVELGFDDTLEPGPFDGRVMRATWHAAGEVCTGRWDLEAETLAGVQCLDLQVPMQFHSAVGGTVDRAHTLLTTVPAELGRFLLVSLSDDGVEVLGRLENPGAATRILDDPQTDFLVFQDFNDAADAPTTQMIREDGTWLFSRPPPGDLQPVAECPCVENDPATCWCLPRTLPSNGGGRIDAFSFWEVADEVHDGVRYVWADVWTDPQIPNTGDPTFELLPFVIDDLVDSFEPVAIVPGFAGYVDLHDCRTVTDSAGADVLPVDGRFVLDDFATYTVRYEGCDPQDGGPPLLPLVGENPPGSTAAFDLAGARVGRGWPIEPADVPPAVVAEVGHAVLLVRETSGWTLIEQDGEGIRRTTVDGVGAEAPRILPDGRLLLTGGGLFDPSTGLVGATVSLWGTPADTRSTGDLLVQDGPDGLRIHDLGQDPPALLVDEVGPRTARLLDVSDDGGTLLETDDSTLWVRRGAEQVDLGSVAFGIRDARLRADGAVAVVGLQTSSVSVQESSLTAWSFDALSLATSVSTALCTTCAADWAFERTSGAVLGPRTGASGLSVYRPNAEAPGSGTWAMEATPVVDSYVAPPSPYAVAGWGTDADGRAWFRQEADFQAFDFATGALTNVAGVDPSGEVRAGPDGLSWWLAEQPVETWTTSDGAGGWVAHHGLVYDAPKPLSGGRAGQVPVGGTGLEVGDWTPGDAVLTGPIEVTLFAPDLLVDAAEPRFAEAPCLLYALGSQPTWVTGASSWACVR